MCSSCSEALDQCPICRSVYTGTRNFTLEDVIRDFRELKLTMVGQSASKPSPAKTSPPSHPPFWCRIKNCGVRLAQTQFYEHLRTVHGHLFFEFCFTFSEERKEFTYRFQASSKANSLKYINLIHYGLFALFFRVIKIANKYMLCSSWIQKVSSTDREAQAFSFTITTTMPSNNQTFLYSDYMHGEESTERDILSRKTCFSVLVPIDMHKLFIDVDIFRTKRELGAARRNKTIPLP